MFVVFSFFRIHEAIPQLFAFKIPLLLSLGALSALLWHGFSKQRAEALLASLFVMVNGVLGVSDHRIGVCVQQRRRACRV